MIERVIDWSAKNPFLVVLITACTVLWGIWALQRTPLDAIPDLSDTQVIIYTEWQGRSPDLVEDQITYPISATLLAAPRVQAVRGFSFLGSSFIYVIFDEGTDIYWARSRIIEYLQAVKNKIPEGVNPVLGPDATSLGWGFTYALVDEKGNHTLADLRSIQDYTVKLGLESVPGVSQVASVGGFVKQYQVNVDPVRLKAYNIALNTVMEAIRKSNLDVEGRLLELSGAEYMIRGRGYLKGIADLKNVPVAVGAGGTPVLLGDIASVQLGPEIRRGVADLDGKGEVAGGIVIVRFGENVLKVIDRVREKIEQEIAPSLPGGVKLVVTYDRSDLIHRSIETLTDELIKIGLAVAVVCLVFLFHLPSALVVILTLPVAIIMSFIIMYYLGITSNIMSLSGIAIAIGTMVDAAIIMVENAHKRLEEWDASDQQGSRTRVIVDAAKEVGPSLFFSLLVITVGFLPVFTLHAQAGRLFKPLAYTKTFAMFFSSLLAITLTPLLMTLFIRGRIRHEDRNPVSRALRAVYGPAARFALRHPVSVIAASVIIVAASVFPVMKLGKEFMPPLNEGTLFYMPVTVPALSISEAKRLLIIQDALIMQVPEVESVFGKAGRAETPTDPAPPEMFETIINLKPEEKWRPGMTIDGIKNELNDKLTIPGVANSFTMPIKARIDMLATGIRTPVGIKVLGSDLAVIERIGKDLEKALSDVPGTRSVYAERATTGYFIDFDINREAASRYGLGVQDVQEVVQSAIGGMTITTTVEGRQRYPVNLRYARELRDDMAKLRSVLVPVAPGSAPGGAGMGGAGMGGSGQTSSALAWIPLSELADVRVVRGPTMIKSEQGLLTAYVYIDFTGRDVGGYVDEARQKAATVSIPSGYRLEWSGEYEFLLKTQETLKVVIPLTLFIIVVLIYLNTGSFASTAIVLLAVPFSLVGSFWLLYLLGYNMSIAVWVGIIALAGLDAETGVIMLLYLNLSHERWKKEGRLLNREDLKEAIMEGAVKRIRPKVMTVATILAGLIPIMFSTGAGSDIMKRIAAPMLGGSISSILLELLIYPSIFYLWKGRKLVS
ncbi:MAG: CusA/CzcA family heavy metal efflux RND transporter [Desulfobacterota bacterium]|nr:CusA/CzcA family heavy metal efflux RND transporter [Thermodesulfobacteriota bacterium]